MANLRIGSTDYMLTAGKVSSPALRLVKGGVTNYGFLTTVKPATKTLKVGNYYLNHPRVPFTISIPISLSNRNSVSYSSYLTQLNVYSASWSFSGSVKQDNSNWEYDNNAGYVKSDSGAFASVTWEDTSYHAVSGSGTLKADSESLANVSQRIILNGVKPYSYWSNSGPGDDQELVTIVSNTYLTGTLTITGYKLP